MDIKIGDYVRTNYGEICKLMKSRLHFLLYETDIEIDRHNDRDCNDCGFDNDTIKDIIKSSSSIIDLIEVGDYVDGHEVYKVTPSCIFTRGGINYHKEDADIKSIVTKEQFVRMKYEVK